MNDYIPLQGLTKMSSISFIVPTMDNQSELKRTVKSLSNALKGGCEVVIVDSSLSPISKYRLNNWLNGSFRVVIVHAKPKGIYAACNKGVSIASGDWLVIMTAGDGLLPNAEKIIIDSIADHKEIFIFSQQVRDSHCRPVYSFIPTDTSVWPTQSVVINRSVYKSIGGYNTDFVSISDQLFFWQARQSFDFEIISNEVSYFCLGGLSGGFSRNLLSENYQLHRYCGQNVIFASLLVFRSSLRQVIEKMIGESRMITLKRYFFENYKKLK
jgi:glycosyltransferase involved in cell wall biosynthesis